MLLQLNPYLPLDTPKGSAQAFLIIDYGPDFHLLFTCIQDDTGEIWTWANPDIRGVKNISLGRRIKSNPVPVAAVS